MLVNEIHGSYSGVVGLPIFETVDLLRNFGIDIKAILQNQR
jgi:predicted house-cleaning NTP pyrophosphatase (Maf/HAM1 superfamily)